MELQTKEILSAIFDRVDAVNTYWNFYIVVSLGLLGIMASAKPFTEKVNTKIILTSGFFVFALSNGWAIWDDNNLRHELIELLPDKYESLACEARPLPTFLLILFHGTIDLVVILSIWFVPWKELDSNESDKMKLK